MTNPVGQGANSAAQAVQAAQGGYTGSVGTGANALQVYMGAVGGGQDVPAADRLLPNAVSVASATQNFYTWAPVEQQAFASKLYRAGIISSPSDFQSAVSFWTSAVNYAASQYTYGQHKVTPWDVVQQSIGVAKAASAKALAPKTTTSTNTAVQVLTNGDANNMINAMYQNELGRNPTDGELSRYRSMLINVSKSQPQVTRQTTTSTPNADGTNTSETSSSVQSGGWTQDGLNNELQGKVQADPEYGAYQAVTTYMGALEAAMGNQPNLVAGGS